VPRHMRRDAGVQGRRIARLAHHEEKKGVLEPGMHADLAVYDADPLTVDDVEGLRPILTVSIGREVWLS